MTPDFEKSRRNYQKVLKLLGSERAEQTTRQPIIIYSGAKDLWVPSLLLSAWQTTKGTVRTLYLSPIPTLYMGRRRPKYMISPNMHASMEEVGDVRSVDAQMVPDLWSAMRVLDTFFIEAPHDPEPLGDALWKMNFPERPQGEERKWGQERTDPPSGARPLDLPVMSLRQQLAAVLAVSR